MSDAPETIRQHNTLYIRHDLASDQVHRLEAEIEELNMLLHAYRQAVFEVKERLGKLDGDQQSWLHQSS